MKILVAGNFSYLIYQEAFSTALERTGHSVIRFPWASFFKDFPGKVQAYFPLPGLASIRMNVALRRAVSENKPDIVLVWRGTHVFPSTYRYIKQTCGSVIISYNNDDPFAPRVHSKVPWHHHFKWYWYHKSHPLVDLVLVFRTVNLSETMPLGARQTAVMMPYFIPDKDRPVVLSEEELERFSCDVVFAGHYEPDGREKYIKGLVKAGLHVRLFGGKYWTSEVLGETASYFGKVREAQGEDYVKALCSAKICLCFLSKMNRDTYTRRCFEIPACGALLLSERTPDLQRLFREDEEAVFFSTVEELVEKSQWLISHPDHLTRISAAGMRRVHKDGHSVDDRAKQFVGMIEGIRANKDL